MADRSPKVMEMVVQELDRNPDVELDALYDRAKELEPEIGELSKRQFHARYPLQAKRQRSQGQGKRPRRQSARKGTGEKSPRGGKKETGRAATGGASREEVRRVLLEFAGDFARAETKPEIVKVLGAVDGYVDRIVKLVSA